MILVTAIIIIIVMTDKWRNNSTMKSIMHYENSIFSNDIFVLFFGNNILVKIKVLNVTASELVRFN